MVNNILVGGAISPSKMMVREFVNGVGMTGPMSEMDNNHQ